MDTAITTDLTRLAAEINTEHRECLQAMRASLTHAVKVGDLLNQAKQMVQHGDWIPWIDANCEFSERTARAYMRVSRNWPQLEKTADIADLTISGALRLLEQPKPEMDRQLADLQARLDAVDTVEDALTIEEEAKVLRDIARENWMRSRAIRDEKEREAMLAINDAAPIPDDTAQDNDAYLAPLDWFGTQPINNDGRWHDIEIGVNMWQKNFCGICGEWGCREPVGRDSSWGSYNGRPGWTAWGLEALGPPRIDWQPVFCDAHDRQDAERYVELTRMFLINYKARLYLDAD